MEKKDSSIKNKKEIFGWAMYDWANSAYATTILAFVFAMYYSRSVAMGKAGFDWHGIHINGASLWAYIVGISLLIVAIISPILGAFVDFRAVKKKFLFAFCYTGALATGLMFFVKGGSGSTPGNWILGGVLFIIANIGFAGGNVFYNSFLPEIATKENMGKVSGIGWATGYVGGLLLLVFNLAMILKPHIFAGLLKIFTLPATKESAIRFSLLSVGIWWAAFAVPTFLLVKERSKAKELPKGYSYVGYTFKRLGETFKKLKSFKMLLFFLIAFLLYNDGIQTVINQATSFGINELFLKMDFILICGIIIQFVAMFGSLGFGFLEHVIGTKRTIMLTLILWLGIIIYAFFLPNTYTTKSFTPSILNGQISLSDKPLIGGQIKNICYNEKLVNKIKKSADKNKNATKEDIILEKSPSILETTEYLDVRCLKEFDLKMKNPAKYTENKSNYYIPEKDYKVDLNKGTLTILSPEMLNKKIYITYVKSSIKNLSAAAINFIILSIAVGIVMGGSQASSRSMLAQFTPKANSAEFFGFFATMGKFASIIGPFVFGIANQITGSLRFGILALGVFIGIGLLLLGFLVDEKKGIEQSYIEIE